MTDYKQLCAELATDLSLWLEYDGPPSRLSEQEDESCQLLARAHAALAEPDPNPVAWMYQGEPSFDGTDWRETWEVTTDKRLAEFKATPDQPIPLFSIPPQHQ